MLSKRNDFSEQFQRSASREMHVIRFGRCSLLLAAVPHFSVEPDGHKESPVPSYSYNQGTVDEEGGEQPASGLFSMSDQTILA